MVAEVTNKCAIKALTKGSLNQILLDNQCTTCSQIPEKIGYSLAKPIWVKLFVNEIYIIKCPCVSNNLTYHA